MLKRPQQETAVPQDMPHLCYGMAYYLLPQMLFSDAGRTVGYFDNPDLPAGVYLYAMACSSQKITPRREDASQFQTHKGTLTDSIDYFVVEYPAPPPFLMAQSGAVLAPFFSAILRGQQDGDVSYYTLGQRPIGGTTLRAVLRDGVNANLGEGPAPDLDGFLNALRLKV